MRCPFCQYPDTQVKDSRPAEDHSAIRRRRVCPNCDGRFTTFERVQLRELFVIKKDGDKVGFDRDKLMRSVLIATRKRPIDRDVLEKEMSKLIRQLESSGDSEIPSDQLGGFVMEVLAKLDQVAYIRYASVYRNFVEAKDFQEFLVDLDPKAESKS